MTLTTMFLVLTVSCALMATQTEPWNNITIGSTLSPTTSPTSWLSPSGRFAFGFYPPGNNASTIGAWLIVSPTENVIVWTLLQKPFSKDALLNLTDTGLELVDPQSKSQLVIEFYNTSALASMLDSGNFVAYGYDGNIMYESFDHPSDTIMGGQWLLYCDRIISSVSETNYSSGPFSLDMQCDGNLVLYKDGIPHWASGTDGTGYTSLNLDTDGDFYLQSSSGQKMRPWSTPTTGSQQSSIYYGKLGWDGIFQLNRLRLDNNLTGVLIEIPKYVDGCQQMDTCGFNGLCWLTRDRLACSCLPGFANATGTGCQRNFTKPACEGNLDTTQYSMEARENITWSNDPYSVLSSSGEEDCKDACLKDCNCDAALFLDQKCWKQKLPLQGGRVDTSVSTGAFIKVLGAPPVDQDARIEKVVSTKAVTICAALVALIYTAFIAIGVSIFVSQVWRYRRKLSKWELALEERIAPLCFSYHELSEATDGFNEVLGSGGFGIVYKGFLSKGKRAIAVKRLELVLGESGFRAEMRAIGKTHHRNLVQLLGFCHEDTHRLLVYEYISNGSLAEFLFKAGSCPSWKERMRIALDVAKGIHYLHEECDNRIIHCDIKPENILIDDKYTAKISDFGLARLLTTSQTRTFTSVGGTRGYAAPERNKNGAITVKADVYSYGIVLLEIICCRRNMEVELDGHGNGLVLSEWVYNLYAARELENLLQGEDVDMADLEKLVRVGIWCVQSEPDSRPHMKKVVTMLEGYMEVPPPPPPRFAP